MKLLIEKFLSNLDSDHERLKKVFSEIETYELTGSLPEGEILELARMVIGSYDLAGYSEGGIVSDICYYYAMKYYKEHVLVRTT
jgi:hypothetical protein